MKKPLLHEKAKLTLTDFITGEVVPDIGAEANRQQVERLLVEKKGYLKKDVAVDVDITLDITGQQYRSQVDLVVSIGNTRLIAVKCAAGSLGSREREILAAARLLDIYQVPFSVVSDGRTAVVLDTISGKKIGEGLEFIPSKESGRRYLEEKRLEPLAAGRLEGEKLIFRTYDVMNINVKRNRFV